MFCGPGFGSIVVIACQRRHKHTTNNIKTPGSTKHVPRACIIFFLEGCGCWCPQHRHGKKRNVRYKVTEALDPFRRGPTLIYCRRDFAVHILLCRDKSVQQKRAVMLHFCFTPRNIIMPRPFCNNHIVGRVLLRCCGTTLTHVHAAPVLHQEVHLHHEVHAETLATSLCGSAGCGVFSWGDHAVRAWRQDKCELGMGGGKLPFCGGFTPSLDIYFYITSCSCIKITQFGQQPLTFACM